MTRPSGLSRSNRSRRRRGSDLLNRANFRPLSSLAISSVRKSLSLGLAIPSVRPGEGRSSLILPLGLSAARRISSSSNSSQASVSCTGTTGTMRPSSSNPDSASEISRYLGSGSIESASRWTKIKSALGSSSSAAGSLSTTFLLAGGCGRLPRSGATPTASSAPQRMHSSWRCGTSAASDGPSPTKRKKTRNIKPVFRTASG